MSSAISDESSHHRILRVARLVTTALLGGAIACAPARQGPVTQDAQLLAPPKDACELAREDARLDPRLDVERVPAPVKMDPPPIKRPVPPAVLRRSRGDTIKAEVLVDTLGRPGYDHPRDAQVAGELVHDQSQGGDRPVDLRTRTPKRV